MRRLLLLVTVSLSLVSPLAGDDFDNWKKMDVPPAPVLEPEEQKETFRIAPGFQIELAAAEPEIVDPVVIRWDSAGRLWAVEMRGYMPNVEGEGEQRPVGKIAVLEDQDDDGYMETRTTFLDNLVMPRALALVEGGVLVAEPPHLWYCRDTDGDLKSDQKTELIRYAKQGPVEHTENGLRQSIDNWIYNAKSERRFLFSLENGKPRLKVDKTRFRGQWGIARDSYGRLYYNTNSSYLSTETFPRNLEKHQYRLKDSMTRSQSVASDNKVYPIRVNPGVTQGFKPDMLRDDGRLNTTTAVAGQAVYRGDQFPDSYRGEVFVPEPAGNVISFFQMKRDGSDVVAQHRTFDDPEWGKREFLASRDERFRPVNVENGPDGALYVVDLYRGILEHKEYITDKYLKKQILARNLDKPAGLGRIWRITSAEQHRRTSTDALETKSSKELVELLSHPNGWHRDWAQRLIIRRRAGDNIIDLLRTTARKAKNHLARIHALWTLQGLRKLDANTIRNSLNDAHNQVRRAAARARVHR